MNELVGDTIEASRLEGLTATGCEVSSHPDVTDASLLDAVRDHIHILDVQLVELA